MKKIVVLIFGLLFFIGCSNSPTSVQNNTNVSQNVTVGVQKTNEMTTVSSHSQDKKDALTPEAKNPEAQKSGDKTKWTQSGNPIDTTSFDAQIKQSENKSKANPKDETLKKSLADAYVARGMALTDARQYASALGDYRKALKLDPENETAKQWIEQIIGIYESINRSYPKEGEEPPPLPFKKDA